MTSPRICNKIDRNSLPWVSSPYSLISWWAMEQFAAGVYFHLGIYLGRISMLIADMHPSRVAPPEMLASYRETLTEIEKQCSALGLSFSADCAHEFLEELEKEVSFKEVQDWYRELSHSISREMKNVIFFFLPTDKSNYYQQSRLFGDLVSAAFPRAQYDIVEAGNCYAMQRSTACVFHLMRVMEVGVQVLGEWLGVTFTDTKEWHRIVDETVKAIKPLPQKDPKTVGLNQAASHLMCVKVAWRNRVMHPHDVYTLEEAKDLLHHVKAFMNTLAELGPPAVP